MKQYCRYCSNLIVGDSNYCDRKKKCMSDSVAKAVNTCKDFEFNPIDAFDLDKTYKPREPKKQQCDGQIKIF